MLLVDALSVRAALEMREEEVQQTLLVSEALRQRDRDSDGREWRWRVEPGMEEAFQDLLGWMMSSQKDAKIETAASSHRSSMRANCEPAACCKRAAYDRLSGIRERDELAA